MKPIKIFCSYARHSRKDESFLNELEKHLSTLGRRDQIEIWHDRKLPPGTDVERETLTHLHQADIILLLISPDYMSDDFCQDIEAIRAIEMGVAGIAHVIAILVRSINWKDAPFGWCQALPANGKFISLWSKRDEAYFNIIQDIKEVVREARDRQTTREVNREKFSPPPPNTTNVITIMPPLAALKVNRQTDDSWFGQIVTTF
jgi:internalin A